MLLFYMLLRVNYNRHNTAYLLMVGSDIGRMKKLGRAISGRLVLTVENRLMKIVRSNSLKGIKGYDT